MTKPEHKNELPAFEPDMLLLLTRFYRVGEKFKANGDFVGYYHAQRAMIEIKRQLKKSSRHS